jgi:predicted glycosyltransferase
MKRRILIWTQHLLGVGHFVRATHVAHALAQDGFEVVVASGGVRPVSFTASGYRVVDLPAVRALDERFDALVDADGAAVSQSLLGRRREMLLALHDEVMPDCIITETFPFGRRLLEEEVLPLLARARARVSRPAIVSSVRDVLQRPRKTQRALAMVARARAFYDCVLVHSDPTIIPSTLSFPELADIDDLVRYTGFIAPPLRSPSGERREILVSAGGGAVGRVVLAAAIEAKPLTRLADCPWTVVTGPLSAHFGWEQTGVHFVRSLPDLATRIAHAKVSVSQAGYNTMVEILAGRTPSVVIPFETEREREQITRARALEALGLVRVLAAADLSVAALARAIDEQNAQGMTSHAINLEGQAGTVSAIRALIGGA